MTRLRWLVIACVALASCRVVDPLPNPPVGSYRAESFQVSLNGATETVQGAAVSDAFFSGGKLRPVLGRGFISQEYSSPARPNGLAPVTMLSYSFWQRKFHADPSVIGKTLPLNGHDAVVVGILPKGFAVPSGTELWVPR
jgi:putative ABC transport system permease protein